LRVVAEWVGPDGHVTGTDIDESMLGAAERFATEAGLHNVGQACRERTGPTAGSAPFSQRVFVSGYARDVETAGSASRAPARRPRSGGIASAASAPTPTSAAPTQIAGVSPSTYAVALS
jgi:hypothetical protein